MIKEYYFGKKKYYLLQISFKDKDGKRIQKKFRFDKKGLRISSRRLASTLEIEYLIEHKARIEEDFSILTFADYHQKYVDEIKLTLRSSTVRNYDGDLKKWLTNEILKKKINEIKKSDIHNFIFEALPLNGARPHTQKKTLKMVKRILECALDEGIIPRNPAQGLNVKVLPPKKLVLNTNEAGTFLEKAREYQHNFYYLWAFSLLTGSRNGESYSLRWADIDLVSGTINITASWGNKDGYHSTKSNKNRIIPISSDLKSLLVELKNIGPFSENLKGLNGSQKFLDDLVLPRFTEWRHGEQSRITKAFCKSIGITEIKFHDLRATFITNLLAQGVSLPKVMSIVGHSRTSTTDEYLRLAGVETKGSTEFLGYKLPNGVKSSQLLLSN